MTTKNERTEVESRPWIEQEPEKDPTETWVKMTHPDVHTSDDVEPAVTTLEAYNEVWESRGWALAEDAGETTGTAPATGEYPQADRLAEEAAAKSKGPQ